MTTAPLVIPWGGADWATLAPILVFALTPLLVLLADLTLPRATRRAASLLLAIAGAIAGGVVALAGWGHPYVAFGGGFVLGGFTIAFEEIVVVATVFSLLMAYRLGREDQTAGGIALMLWSASGAMLMAGAANLMTIFLGLELLSLGLYCLCGLAPRAAAREAALKYLILSSTASGFMLYGMALLFGTTGSIELAALAAGNISAPLFAVGVGLFAIGFACGRRTSTKALRCPSRHS
jgi:NADH-quinone oxidoreductase subunit N